MATTPPPPTNLRMPPTPRHGAGYDGYDPYGTRHSSRIASRRAAAKSHSTPPPTSPTDLQDQTDMGVDGVPPKANAMGALSPPSSTQNSPRRKAGNRVKVVPGSSLSINNERHIPSTSNSSTHTTQNQNTLTHNNRTIMADETLPTPVKTPRKKMVPDSSMASRVLFPNNPATESGNAQTQKPVKKGKKYSAFSLESFNENGATENQGSLQIFTDSRDRIPEVHQGEDNPFYQKPAVAAPEKNNTTARTTKRRKVDANGDTPRDKEVDEAVHHRDDGMFYVFRGKKFFRKFKDDSEEEDNDEFPAEGLFAGRSNLEDPLQNRNIRPLTRSSVKPRLLFPTAAPSQPDETKAAFTDEEAATDIEDLADGPGLVDAHSSDVVTKAEPTTPTNQTLLSSATTPSTPRFTGHSLRSQSKQDKTPVNCDRANASFGSWKRTKSSDGSATSTPKARKRGVSSAGSVGPAKKKVRGT
ncbi:hypothetical protein FQN54_008497 [Arachnomyces sp. PD_36]|nr:hypothetical protein FQN54_008497 [Arachnomyces sp. PD_36]